MMLMYFASINEARFITEEEPVPKLLVKLRSQPSYDNREERKQFVDEMFNKVSFQQLFQDLILIIRFIFSD